MVFVFIHFVPSRCVNYRVQKEEGHERDFLTVGSMGHASSIAMGIALQKPSRQVITYFLKPIIWSDLAILKNVLCLTH